LQLESLASVGNTLCIKEDCFTHPSGNYLHTSEPGISKTLS